MKLTLTSLTRYANDKEGKPLVTKDNRPYTRLLIRAKEYGDKPISGFDSIQTQGWREGDEVEVEVEQKGEYLNFKLPNRQDLVSRALEVVQNQQTKILMLLQEIHKNTQPKEEVPYPEGEPEEPDFNPFSK